VLEIKSKKLICIANTLDYILYKYIYIYIYIYIRKKLESEAIILKEQKETFGINQRREIIGSIANVIADIVNVMAE